MTHEPRIAFVLAQPGAESFFAPVLADTPFRTAATPLWLTTNDSGTAAPSNATPTAVETVGAQLAAFDPACVVTSTSGNPVERAAVDWAATNARPLVQVIDSWYDYGTRLHETNGPDRLPHRILVLDEAAAAGARAEGLPADRIDIVGNPAWAKDVDLPAAPWRNVLLVDQPITLDHGLERRPNEMDMLEIAGTWYAARGRDAGFHVTFAPHPRRGGPPAGLPADFAVASDSRAALASCGSVVGLYSSLMVDAALAGRRVISVQPGIADEAGDRCILSRTGAAPRVTTADGLHRALVADPPPSDAGDPSFAARFHGSRERVVRVLLDAAGAAEAAP